jgi:hypothetical protein
MTQARSFCPDELSKLAKLVNEKAKCGRVNFFATQEEGAETVSYFAIFQSGPKRETKPLKDWSSHAADSFGLMAMDYEEPRGKEASGREQSRSGGTHWSA